MKKIVTINFTEKALKFMYGTETTQEIIEDTIDLPDGKKMYCALYTTAKGAVYKEYIQTFVETTFKHSQLYCAFFSLKDKDGYPVEKFLWTEEEIAKTVEEYKNDPYYQETCATLEEEE